MIKRVLIFLSYNIIRFFPKTAEIFLKFIEAALVNLPLISSWKYIWTLFVRQRWQFYIERSLYDKGKGRVADPLFACRIKPGPVENHKNKTEPAGYFYLMFIYSGLNISGSISGDKSEGKNIIEIFINDKIIKQIQTKHGLFNIRIFRSTVDLLPKSLELSIRVKDGEYLFYKSSKKAVIEIPHGNGSVFDKLNKGFSLSKKGTFSLTGKEMGERQKCYLENYSKLKLFFEKELGKPLFLIYGTLLGFYRDGDFIPGDDDFDCCYISHETDPVRVKNETRRIVMKLVQSGFTVSFNRTGRLFRIPVGKNRDGAYIDICPVWFKNGNLWTHPLTTVPAGVNDFLPVNTGIFKGTEVFIPKSPEVFLAGYYGPGWKVPDPSYVTDMTKIKSKDIKFLKKAYITPKEYREMDKMLNKTHTNGNGRLVSGSLQDLYPLADFIF